MLLMRRASTQSPNPQSPLAPNPQSVTKSPIPVRSAAVWGLHDYNGLAAVVGGLTNSAVDHMGKLRHSWQPEAVEAFAPLKDLVGWKQASPSRGSRQLLCAHARTRVRS